MNKKLEEWNKFLKNKKIAIIGAGVSNIPLMKELHKNNLDITIFDKNDINKLPEEASSYIKKYNIKTSLRDNYLDNLVGYDVIFRSPSFLPTNKYLVKEQERGALITTEIEQVIKLSLAPIIGVTGSKGKTTTTTIINAILSGLGYHTYLGGNIGLPLYNKLDEITKEDIVILELSSFQLMNMTVSPHISVVTNISPDHLDIHGSYDEYINAKKYIFLNQQKEDILVLNKDDKIVKDFKKEAKGHIRYFGKGNIKDSYTLNKNYITYNDELIIDTNKLILKGDHNYINICAALNAIKDYIKVPNEELEKVISNISPVKHRLEFVRNINGVKWYNDSASTTPDKAIAGIEAFDNNIILIAGGWDKNISYAPLAEEIGKKVKKLILFGETKQKIYDEVMKLPRSINANIEIYLLDNIEEVVSFANRISQKDDIVLFSPASASFDMFKNAYQRGDIFRDLVNKL